MRNIFIFCLLAGFLFVSGCCKTCPPPKIVPVYKECKLPGKILLEFPSRVTTDDCKSSHVCFEKSEFGKMVFTIDSMIMWIKQAKARCGKRASTTQPSG